MIGDSFGNLAYIFMVLLAYTGLTNCLVKMDFNFTIAIFACLIWKAPKHVGLNVKVLLYVIFGVAMIWDCLEGYLFFDSWWNSRVKRDQNANIWGRMGDLHFINIISLLVTLVLKVLIIVCLFFSQDS